jgi:uncharacterized protein DUF4252
MRKLIFVILIFAATPAVAQQINLQSIDKFAAKAKDKTEVSLDASTLKFASGFLSNKKAEEASAKQVTDGLKAINVRTYRFYQNGEFTQADLQPIRDQLKTPQWSRVVKESVQDPENQDTEVWVHRDGNAADGLLILSTKSNEITVVNLVGRLEPGDLGILGGQFGVPKIENLKKD